MQKNDNISPAYTHLSAIYDIFMSDVNTDEWVSYIDKILIQSGACKGRVVETACGTGRISLPLKKAGYNIACCDSSAKMLAIAQENARKYGLKIPFVKQDMRKLDMGVCSAVICCCDGVNYLTSEEDALSFFKSAYSSLKPGGVLLFDISSEHKYRNILANNIFYEDTDDVTYFWQNSYEHPILSMEITVFSRKNEFYIRADEEHTQRCWSCDQLINLLENAGFVDVKNYEFGSFTFTESCDRVQFVATKK